MVKKNFALNRGSIINRGLTIPVTLACGLEQPMWTAGLNLLVMCGH